MITKYENNPVVTPSDVKPSAEGYKVLGAFNPGATLYNDEVILLLRVAESVIQKDGFVSVPIAKNENGIFVPGIMDFKKDDPDVKLKDTRGVVYKGKDFLSTMSHIRVARSKDGFNFKVDDKPFIFPGNDTEKYGVEDARVTKIEGQYYINYSAVSPDSWATALATTEDFINVNRKGLIFHPENKDVAIFSEKVNGLYYALHRPNNSGFGKASIWYSESPDLLHWEIINV